MPFCFVEDRAIVIQEMVTVGVNFVGLNPMKVLVFPGIVQGFSTPPLMLLIMLMTNKRAIMGDQVNGAAMNVLGGSQQVPSLQLPLA